MHPVPPRSVLRAGLVGGAVLVYLALVGLVERFADLRLVGEQITLGRLLLVVPSFAAAFAVARPRVVAGERRVAGLRAGLLAGALTGAVTSGVFAASAIVAERIDVERIRQVFITVTPGLIDFATFERGLAVGSAILLVLGLIAGGLGGMARAADRRVVAPLSAGAVTVIVMGLLQRIVPVAMQELGVEPDFLYSPRTRSLTWVGAAGLFVLAAAADAAWRRSGPETRRRVRSAMVDQPATRVGLVLLALAILGVLPLLVGSVISQVLGSVMVFVLLGLGLNIVVGYAGLLDLGYVAFYAFGAYMTALLTGATLNTTTGSAAPAWSADLNFYVAIWIVVLLAAGVGLLIGAPVLRLRGDYLAIVTLGLGEIVRVLAESQWLQPLVGGPQGMRGVTNAAIGGVSFRPPQHFYWLVLAFVVLAVFVSWRLAWSRIGRAWNAMREDEQVADAMGISTTKYKLLAFAMGGAVGSLGGALFAVQIGSLTPASFQIIVSITALAVVILGGMGSIPGVVAGAAVLIGLPGLLREFEEFRLLIYGGVLVAIMILRPQGLIPSVRRMRELHEEEVEQDAWVQRFAGDAAAVAAAVPGGVLGVEEEDLK